MTACTACDHSHFVTECRCGCHWPVVMDDPRVIPPTEGKS